MPLSSMESGSPAPAASQAEASFLQPSVVEAIATLLLYPIHASFPAAPAATSSVSAAAFPKRVAIRIVKVQSAFPWRRLCEEIFAHGNGTNGARRRFSGRVIMTRDCRAKKRPRTLLVRGLHAPCIE